MGLYLLHQAASGYCLFFCHDFEIGKNGEAVADLDGFCKMVKLVAFQPFKSNLHALNQIIAFSLGEMTDELHNFLALALPKLQEEEGNNSKLTVGLADPKLGSHILQVTKVPCQTNDFILRLLCGVQLHVDRIINPTMNPFFSKCRKLSASLPDWSKLPTDILESIIVRMSCFDIIRFKHVCRSWKIAVSNSCVISLSPSQPPYFMLSTADNKGCCFFNIANQKLHHEFNNLWGDLDIYCIGCSKGWLILHVKDEKSKSQSVSVSVSVSESESESESKSESPSVFIFNPFRLEARKIIFPSNATPPNFRITRVNYQTLLTSDPIHSGGKFGVVFRDFTEVTLLMQDSYHPENNKWTKFSLSACFDMTYTRDCIFGFCFGGKLEVCTLASTTKGLLRGSKGRITYKGSRNYYVSKILKSWEGPYPTPRRDTDRKMHLVESEGEILLVMRSRDLQRCENFCRTTKFFTVFEFSFHKKQWSKLESLGDRVLFLGSNQSLCLSVMDIQGCKGNSIYFTDHGFTYKPDNGGDTGVFSLEDGSIKQLIPSESIGINQRGIWLV